MLIPLTFTVNTCIIVTKQHFKKERKLIFILFFVCVISQSKNIGSSHVFVHGVLKIEEIACIWH